jgi:hypothetical protein
LFFTDEFKSLRNGFSVDIEHEDDRHKMLQEKMPHNTLLYSTCNNDKENSFGVCVFCTVFYLSTDLTVYYCFLLEILNIIVNKTQNINISKLYNA